jgi:hypothetical protein
MKQDTRNYGKFHQRFARGGAVKEKFDEMGKDVEPEMGDSNYEEGGMVVKAGGETLDPVTGDAMSQAVKPEAQAGGGASWATERQKSRAAWRIKNGYVP